MTTIAIIGPDGAGKTTIARRLAADPTTKVAYLYLGVNPEASNHMLPTTRLVAMLRRGRSTADEHGPPPDVSEVLRSGGRARPLKELKSTLRVLNQIADEWYRQAIAWVQQRRGYVVVFDRHYLADYASHDASGTRGLPFHRRLHGFVLRHLHPGPDEIVMLDAPAEVLLARKGEGTVEALERRRRDYLALRSTVSRFHVVDASNELDVVYADVARIVAEAARR